MTCKHSRNILSETIVGQYRESDNPKWNYLLKNKRRNTFKWQYSPAVHWSKCDFKCRNIPKAINQLK